MENKPVLTLLEKTLFVPKERETCIDKKPEHLLLFCES